MNNEPRQLEILRKEHYNKLYSRQPQLMRKLFPLLNKSDLIEDFLEIKIKRTEPIKTRTKVIDKRRISKGKKINKKYSRKKISEIKPKVLWGLR